MNITPFRQNDKTFMSSKDTGTYLSKAEDLSMLDTGTQDPDPLIQIIPDSDSEI